ncbi:hypothetical protein Gotur_001143 [Gossypium turneri]
MEDGLANLKIQDGEEEKGVEEEMQQEFCLVGCFLTALMVNFQAMKNMEHHGLLMIIYWVFKASGERGPDGSAIDLFFFLGSSSRFVAGDDVEGSSQAIW